MPTKENLVLATILSLIMNVLIKLLIRCLWLISLTKFMASPIVIINHVASLAQASTLYHVCIFRFRRKCVRPPPPNYLKYTERYAA